MKRDEQEGRGTRRILVVDDEPPVLNLITGILRTAGFQVLGVSETRLVMDRVREFRPHLVLTDLDMPGLDGSEICILLKSLPETAAIPIVFLSGRTLDADHDLGLFSGASAYLDKPVSSNDLVRTVRSVLGQGVARKADR